MSYYGTVMNRLLQLIPRHQFDKLVKKYGADRYVKYFSCWQLFVTLLYAQIRKKDSLRDIETSLTTQMNRWYHLGLENIKRSTLSDANNRIDYRVFEEMFYMLLDKYRSLSPNHKFKFKSPLYSLDSTVIEWRGVYFVSRAKKNMKYELIGQHKVDVDKSVIFDVEILLTIEESKKDYPEKLRLVGYIDEQTNKEFTFLTNNFQLSAYTIAQIYKSRWQIEIFFK